MYRCISPSDLHGLDPGAKVLGLLGEHLVLVVHVVQPLFPVITHHSFPCRKAQFTFANCP